MGRTGDTAQQGDHQTGGENGFRLTQELPHHVIVQTAVGHGTGDHHGRGCGDHQRGHLADQAVTDGCNGVDVPDVLHTVQAAQNHAAYQVDERDNQGQRGVALDEFGSAVHGAVEIGFLLNLGAAGLGPLLVNESGTQVRVDGHLLAGHGVQGEPGRHLTDALRALGHHNQLHQYDNQEDDNAQHDISLGNHVAEGQNYAARITVVAQNGPGSGYVQSQPEQRGNQQQGRENGEVQSIRNRHGDDKNQHRQGDVHHQQHIQQGHRQRNNDKQDNDDYRERYGVLENSLHGHCPFQK